MNRTVRLKAVVRKHIYCKKASNNTEKNTMKTSMFRPLFALLTLLSLSSAASTPSDPCDREDANGCTTLPYTHFPFQKDFTPSCNRHDMCYGCAAKFGLTRKDCDDALLRNVVQTCRALSTPNSQDSQQKNGFFSFARKIRNFALTKTCKEVNSLLRGQNEAEVECKNNVKFLECIEVTLNAYAAVRSVGSFFYSKIPEGYCDKDFIPNCLPDIKNKDDN
ncbi:hypothetical protein RRG08_012460 [Elysia crispata]|uniref:Uncharacterized protein n=1 Tax=Elysia crispata TaxID=231223 RepID=A0AAE1A361_9GAST|nr:hypothetical protein RRG08_012460 [Elysia crispata]